MSVEDTIVKKKKEAEEKLREAEALEARLKAFPDLQRHVNRWNRERFYAKSVNSRVNAYELGHNCGCCSDSTLELWPYLETEHGRIYSDPPKFTIGEKDYRYGDMEYTGWESQLEAAGIPLSLIAPVQASFIHDQKVRDTMDEDE